MITHIFMFNGFLRSLGISEQKQKDIRWCLKKQYHQIHRHYHTFEHIEYMFKISTEITSAFSNRKSKVTPHKLDIQLAIFYHDVIYEPKRDDNEEKSAEFFVEQLGKYLPKETTDHVVEMILATKKHEIKDPNDTAMAYFLDIDLGILGSSYSQYDRYAYNIRQEYCYMSDEDYCKSRIAILENFLQRKRIYFTDYYYERLEQQARQNLQAEIEFLKSW